MTIKYYTRTTAKKSAVPLYLRFTDGRNAEAWVKLPILVNPANWSNKTGKFKQILKDPVQSVIKKNKEVEVILDQLRNFIADAMPKTTNHDRAWITNLVSEFYNPSRQEAITLNSYISKYIDEAENGTRLTKDGKRYAEGSLKSLRNFKTLFNEFQGRYSPRNEKRLTKEGKEKRKEIVIDFENVTIDTYNDFVKFLNDKNYSSNTIGKHVKSWKTIMGESLDNGKHKNTEFKRKAFRAINSEVETVSLTEDELFRLYSLNLPDRMEIEARDLFLIGCWTCQRFSDYSRINKISTMEDGTKVIRIVQQKTGAKVTVPVNLFGAGLYSTLMKYAVNKSEQDIKLPKLSDTELNYYIKLVCRKAKITELVDIHKTKGGLVASKPYQKCTLICSHTARRTGTSILVNKGVPTLFIMKVGGWKTEREFMKYVKLSADQIAKKLATMDFSIGNNYLRKVN
ncbi:MAG TPA: tyrosine-type recombinase/integrase [Bacteroidales bacterium]|nr:tyrosine-type recombinase/integrase [Bacteroidales bacterium]